MILGGIGLALVFDKTKQHGENGVQCSRGIVTEAAAEQLLLWQPVL